MIRLKKDKIDAPAASRRYPKESEEEGSFLEGADPDGAVLEAIIDGDAREIGSGRRNRRAGGPRTYVLKRSSLFLWSACLSVILVWVFGLGVLAGRGTIFQTPIFQDLVDRVVGRPVERKPPVVEVASENISRPAPAPETEPKLTFYSSLTRTSKSPAKDDETFKIKPDPAGKPKSGPDQAKLKAETAIKADAKPAAGAAKPDQSAAPAGSPPTRKPGENFSIQVATARSPEEAERMTGNLRSRGFDAYYYRVDQAGTTMYRVRVGRYGTRQEAKAAMDKLIAAGHRGMFISSLTD
ncbi:MAG: SPOR domain-containing protein [Thermodesulfobacteriota bacterium]